MSVSLARRILAQGVVPAEVLNRALFESLRRATPLLQTLVEARADLSRALAQLLGIGHTAAPENWSPDRHLMTQLPPGMCERLLAFPIRAGADGEVEVVAADAADPHVTREFVAHLGSTVIVMSAPLAQVLAAAGVRSKSSVPERAAVRVAAVASESERPIPLVRKSSAQSKDRVATTPGLGEKGATDSAHEGAPDKPEFIEPPPSSRSLSSVPVRSAVPPSPRPGTAAPTRVSTSAAPNVNEPPALRVPTERGLRLTPGAERKQEPQGSPAAVKATSAEALQPTKPLKATVPEVPKPVHFGKVTMPDAPRALAKPAAPEAPKPVATQSTSAEAPKAAPVVKPSVAEPAKSALKATVIETPKPVTKAVAATPKPAPVAKADVAVSASPKPAPVAAADDTKAVVAAEAPKPAPVAKAVAGETPKPRSTVQAKAPEVSKPAVAEQQSIVDALQAVELPPLAPTASPAPPPAEPLRVGVPPVEPAPVAKAPAVAMPKPAPVAAPSPAVATPKPAPVAARPADKAAQPTQVSARAFVPKTPLGGGLPAQATGAPARRVVPGLRAEEVEDRLVKAENPDEIARCLALGGGTGTVVFGVRPDQFVVRALGADEARPDLTLPRDAASVMRVAAEQDEFLGPLFDAPAHEPLFTWIESGSIVFAAAVKVRERAALVLLLPVGTNEEETRRLGRRLARAGARALEELIVRRKRTSHP